MVLSQDDKHVHEFYHHFHICGNARWRGGGARAYNVTKAAVVAISETLYGELMDFGVKVSCIQPAYFKTNIAQNARGGELVKKTTQFFIDHSGLEAKDVAEEILHRAGKGEFYIILPKQASKMWRQKRFAPTWFRRMVKEKFMAAARKVR